MKYDFDQVIDRHGTDSSKWDCGAKGVCLLLVYLIIRSLPDRFLIKLPYGKYVTRKQYREEDIDFGEE